MTLKCLHQEKTQLQIYRKFENLQNFFNYELLDVRAEIKNVTCSKIPDLTENKPSNKIDVLGKQITCLTEECQTKTL